jgi:putative transposase
MYQVEKHNIDNNHALYKHIDELSFRSKNLYNVCNYVIRQNYFNRIKLDGKTHIITKENSFNIDAKLVYEHILNGGCTDKKYLNYGLVDKMLIKSNQVDYRDLPAKVSKQILIQIDKNWKSFFEANKDFKKNPSKYKAQPRLPKYKHKTKCRNIIKYELGAISRTELQNGYIKLSQTNIKIPFMKLTITLIIFEKYLIIMFYKIK